MRYKLLYSILLIFININVLAQEQNRGIIKGKLTSSSDGMPLIGATVIITGTTKGAISDENGSFTITNSPTGYISLTADILGYKSTTTPTFLVTNSSPSEINISMESTPIAIEDIVVTASPYTSTVESPVSLRQVGIEEIEKTPGGNRDISRVIQSSPGVLATPIQRNDLLVRGGGANENKYFLDGIEIPILNHFAIQGGSGGNASLVNTDFLSRVNFYTSAFPSGFSNGLSSVMDMRLKNGNSDKFRGKFTIGASDIGASVDTPISKNKKTTLLASYRRSYLQMLFNVLGLPFLPTYNDAQFKINTEFDSKNELSFIGLGSFDDNVLNTGIKNPDDKQKYILGYLPENRQKSYVIGTTYRHSIKNGKIRFILSRNYFENHLFKFENNNSDMPKTLDFNSKESDNRLRFELDKQIGWGMRLTTGAGVENGQYFNSTYRKVFFDNQEVTEDYKSRLSIFRYSFFATLSKYFFDERLSLLFGIRSDANNYSSYTNNPLEQLSPRISASMSITDKWKINAGISKYYQEPSYTTMGYRNNDGVAVNKDNGLKYISAAHYVAGVEFNPTPTQNLSIEGFFKHYKNYPVSLVDSLPLSTIDTEAFSIGDVPVKSVGVGRAYGMEISYRNSNFKNTIIDLSYTLLYSEFKKPNKNLNPTNTYIPSSWDARHIISLMGIHKFEYNWEAGLKWRYMGGTPYSPYDLEKSSLIDAWDALRRPYVDYSLFNTNRLKPYHQLDLRVDKTWFFNKWTLGIYLDIQNIYNYSAKGQDIVMPETDVNGNYIPDPNKPGYYKMTSIKNTIGGTILPTFGLIIGL